MYICEVHIIFWNSLTIKNRIMFRGNLSHKLNFKNKMKKDKEQLMKLVESQR
jgi:hypothetical protein